MAGIITLEDVIEKLLLEEIDDEADDGRLKHSHSFWDSPKAYSTRETGDTIPEGRVAPSRSFCSQASAPGGLERPLLGGECQSSGQESSCCIA